MCKKLNINSRGEEERGRKRKYRRGGEGKVGGGRRKYTTQR